MNTLQIIDLSNFCVILSFVYYFCQLQGTDSLKDKTLSIPRDKEPATSEISPDSPTCRVGDLVWASVSGKASSWWPAMVTYDPDQAVYFRFKNGKRLEYHVQWFGKGALRSWVQASRMKRFTSLDQYDMYVCLLGIVNVLMWNS